MLAQVPGEGSQGEAAQHHEQQEGQPESMVAQPLQRPGKWQQQDDRQEHAVAHFPRAGGADEQAIEQVAPDRNQRQYREVRQVDEGGVAHTRYVCLQGNEQMAGAQEQQGKAQAGDQ
ncbi:hypothetical protein D3C76_1462620 [compost metagenome]